MRKLILGSSCLVLLACGGKGDAPAPASSAPATAAATKPAHESDDHAHKSPHGGVMVAAGDYHLEAVSSKMGLVLYLYDSADKPMQATGVTGTITVTQADGQKPVTTNVSAMGNHLMTDVNVTGAWSAVANLTIAGKPVAARFESKGEVGHAHGGHDMPPMELSKTVTSTVVPEGAIAAGSPTTLVFGFKDTAGTALTDFEVSHERRLHVFIVREDLDTYAHEHPDVKSEADGTWTLAYTFPTPGKYRVYSDFKSKAHGANVTVSDVVVPGDAPAPTPLVADVAPRTFGELTIALTLSPTPIKAGAATTLTYRVSDKAGDVTNLEPYLGAMGHLFVLGQDLVTMAHSHPEGMDKGPTVTFMAIFPKPGKYKLWAQFQRAGAIITTFDVIEVM